MTFYFDFSFTPVWESISELRNLLTCLLSDKGIPIDNIRAVTIAASELLENLFKYSATEGVFFHMDLDMDGSTLNISSYNKTENEYLNNFEDVFAEISDGDAKAVYRKMMLRSITSSDISQLGLARIRYEGAAEITYDIINGNEVVDLIRVFPATDDLLKILRINLQIPVKICS